MFRWMGRSMFAKYKSMAAAESGHQAVQAACHTIMRTESSTAAASHQHCGHLGGAQPGCGGRPLV